MFPGRQRTQSAKIINIFDLLVLILIFCRIDITLDFNVVWGWITGWFKAPSSPLNEDDTTAAARLGRGNGDGLLVGDSLLSILFLMNPLLFAIPCWKGFTFDRISSSFLVGFKGLFFIWFLILRRLSANVSDDFASWWQSDDLTILETNPRVFSNLNFFCYAP